MARLSPTTRRTPGDHCGPERTRYRIPKRFATIRWLITDVLRKRWWESRGPGESQRRNGPFAGVLTESGPQQRVGLSAARPSGKPREFVLDPDCQVFDSWPFCGVMSR